jgi:hypothetical protein
MAQWALRLHPRGLQVAKTDMVMYYQDPHTHAVGRLVFLKIHMQVLHNSSVSPLSRTWHE